LPSRLADCEVLPNSAVNNEGELIHFALLADKELVNFTEALQMSKWKKAMMYELSPLKRTKLGS
jgi:hypothetical protein